jgi:hypothetical protein
VVMLCACFYGAPPMLARCLLVPFARDSRIPTRGGLQQPSPLDSRCRSASQGTAEAWPQSKAQAEDGWSVQWRLWYSRSLRSLRIARHTHGLAQPPATDGRRLVARITAFSWLVAERGADAAATAQKAQATRSSSRHLCCSSSCYCSCGCCSIDRVPRPASVRHAHCADHRGGGM